MKTADEILRHAAHHLMDGTNIWYDLVPLEHGGFADGPVKRAVTILCVLASDIRTKRIAEERK